MMGGWANHPRDGKTKMFDKLRRLLPQRNPDHEEIHQKLRQLMIGMNLQGARNEEARDVRRLALSLAKLAGKPGELGGAIKGLGDTEAFHTVGTLSWLSPEAIADGESGPFEACSLLAWLEIARKAGVPHIPAKVILRLTDAETEMASGDLPAITGPIPDRIRQKLKDAIARDADLADALAAPSEPVEAIDKEVLVEKLFACMDEVPEGWMVRTNQCGPSTLKALAGTGMVDEEAPQVPFGRDLEIGPGWIRVGNRRMVDTKDRRLISSYVAGPHTGAIYIARPWIRASRYVEGRDPHRAGTPFDTPGVWPAEWRAFVKNGQVSGISSYYCWTEIPSPFNARVALQVRDLAQRIVDTAIAQGLEPRYAEVEHGRRNPELAQMLEDQGFGVGTFSATLDFIETADGLMLLEAGPGNTPLGGGHPCGFAGTSGQPRLGNLMQTEGVAFRHMPHVLIGEPKTWADGDRTGCILGWAEVEALASTS